MSTLLTARRLRRSAGILAAAGAVALLAGACSAAQPGSGGSTPPTTRSSSSVPGSTKTPGDGPGTSTGKPTPGKTKQNGPPPIKVKLTGYPDGGTFGVGEPIVVNIYKSITSAKAFVADTKVTVNGKPADGAWYFVPNPLASDDFPMQAHYRPKTYWPAHSDIHVSFDLKGQSAGKSHGRDMVFQGKLTSLDFHTGARTIATVNQSTHQMTVMSDGKLYGTFPVSLGTSETPTRRGTKVIMQQNDSICMTDTASTYYECGIKWDQRLTYDGEYLHAAPWNNSIGSADLSNGCTNLTTADADKLYHFMHDGDVVEYPNADGPQMQLNDGIGDWNVDWTTWLTGGLLNTHSA